MTPVTGYGHSERPKMTCIDRWTELPVTGKSWIPNHRSGQRTRRPDQLLAMRSIGNRAGEDFTCDGRTAIGTRMPGLALRPLLGRQPVNRPQPALGRKG